MQQSKHFVPKNRILDQMPIHLIGLGATGSVVLRALSSINSCMKQLGSKTDLQVIAFDHDKIEEHNIGKQAYVPSDIGRFKAEISIMRQNMAFGTNWKFCNQRWSSSSPAMCIICVDSPSSRKEIYESDQDHYFLDCGNGRNHGQVIFGTKSEDLKSPHLRYPQLITEEEGDNPISCSMIESLHTQSLFINSFISNLAAEMLWNLIHLNKIEHAGYFINMDTTKISRIPL